MLPTYEKEDVESDPSDLLTVETTSLKTLEVSVLQIEQHDVLERWLRSELGDTRTGDAL